MPLLTLAMEDVPAEDAGLGSGITSLSQQIGGALGLAVLSTIAANHTKALSDDHGVTSALIGGYQLAFLAGALAIATGIVLAFALLRPPDRRQELELAAGWRRRPPCPHQVRHRGESSMTRLDPARPANDDGRPTPPRRAAHASAREARTRRSFDGVLASYIRELAAAADPAPRPRTGREPRGC